MLYQRKKKTCVECGSLSYIYARKMCQRCYGKTLKTKKPVKKVKPAFGFISERELFFHIWRESDKTCRISGESLMKYLATDKFFNCFSHLLPKGLYGLFRLNPLNVWLVSPDIHWLIDFGTQDDRDKSGYDFTHYFAEVERLKQEYQSLKL